MAGKKAFRLALGQMRVLPGEVEVNQERALACVAKAAQGGAEMVLLPEALPCGWTDPSSESAADRIPEGRFSLALREAARRHATWICAGVVERAGDRVFNSAVLIDRAGNVLLVHRKLNELAIGHSCYALGDRLGVVETEFGRIGVMICADAFAPGQVVSRTLAMMGARIILSPCAWAVPPDHDNTAKPYGQLWLNNYGPVARDFGLWIAGCSNVGPIRAGAWAGHKCIGCSMVIGPAGNEILRGPYGHDAEEVLYAEVAVEPEWRPAA